MPAAVLRRTVERADAFQRGSSIPRVLVATVKKFGEDRAGQLAALIAYYGFFSLFPLLLALVTGVALVVDDPAVQRRVLDAALGPFPVIGERIGRNIRALPAKGAALAIGLAGAVWAGLGVVRAAQAAMNRIWHVPVRRQPGLVVAVLRGLVMLATLGVFVLVASVLGGGALAAGGGEPWVRGAAAAGSALMNLAVFLVAFRILTVADVGWRDVLPGAALAAIGWTLLQATGGYLVGRQLERAAPTYGFFAVVIGALTWLSLGAQLTLFAAELNVVLARGLSPRSLDPEDLTEADRRALTALAKVEERREEEDVDVRFEEGDGRRAAPGAARSGRGGDSIPALLRAIATDASTLVRKEIELARQELAEGVRARAVGLALFGAAAVAGLFLVLFLGLAGAAALALVLPAWAAYALVAATFAVLAAGTALVGRRALRRTPLAARRTRRTIEEDVRWVRDRLRR